MSESPSSPPCRLAAVTPYLILRNAAEAVGYYLKVFGAVEVYRMTGPDGKAIMHGEIRIGDSMIFFADEFPDWGIKSPLTLGGSPVALHLSVPNVDEVFDRAVAAGATVIMPVQNQFWGDRYGKLVDPNGHVWGIATEVESLTAEEINRRAAEAMKPEQ